MKNQQTIVVTFVDGKTMKFVVPQIEGTRTGLASIITRARSDNNFLLESDGKLIVIPMANVRTLEISPLPPGPAIPGLLTGAKQATN